MLPDEAGLLKIVKHLLRLHARETREQALERAAQIAERMPADTNPTLVAEVIRQEITRKI